MLFHLSIDADQPEHVARVLAELWAGEALPFPPVIEGSWVAMSGDDRGTIVEVYPRGTELREGPGAADSFGMIGSNGNRSATHFAMATAMTVDQVLAITKREGWPAKVCLRGGVFGVIEIFVEGARMIEVLTPEMQRQYVGAMTIDNWRAMLAAPRLAERHALAA